MPKLYPYELKISVVKFYKSELWSIQYALEIFNVSKSSIYNYINLEKDNSLTESSNVRDNYERKISDEIEIYIVKYVTKKINFVCKNLKRCIKNIFNIKLSRSSIYRILKKHNITNKKIYNKYVPPKRNIKKEVKKLLKDVKEVGINNIVSIDESSFDTHIRPNNGWSKKGSAIKRTITPVRKRKTLTLAVTSEKVLDYDIINGSSNALNFEKFLKEKLLPKMKNQTILMDNVRFHHSKIVKDAIINTGNNILYNVSYNPDSNPVENCFSVSKNYVKKSEPNNEEELEKSIIESLNLLTKEKLSNMFINSLIL